MCSSGLQANAIAAQRIIVDRVPACVAGGLESISLVQNEHTNTYYKEDPGLLTMQPDIFMPMLNTAENVAKHYAVSREMHDDYALVSQERPACWAAADRS